MTWNPLLCSVSPPPCYICHHPHTIPHCIHHPWVVWLPCVNPLLHCHLLRFLIIQAHRTFPRPPPLSPTTSSPLLRLTMHYPHTSPSLPIACHPPHTSPPPQALIACCPPSIVYYPPLASHHHLQITLFRCILAYGHWSPLLFVAVPYVLGHHLRHLNVISLNSDDETDPALPSGKPSPYHVSSHITDSNSSFLSSGAAPFNYFSPSLDDMDHPCSDQVSMPHTSQREASTSASSNKHHTSAKHSCMLSAPTPITQVANITSKVHDLLLTGKLFSWSSMKISSITVMHTTKIKKHNEITSIGRLSTMLWRWVRSKSLNCRWQVCGSNNLRWRLSWLVWSRWVNEHCHEFVIAFFFWLHHNILLLLTIICMSMSYYHHFVVTCYHIILLSPCCYMLLILSYYYHVVTCYIHHAIICCVHECHYIVWVSTQAYISATMYKYHSCCSNTFISCCMNACPVECASPSSISGSSSLLSSSLSLLGSLPLISCSNSVIELLTPSSFSISIIKICRIRQQQTHITA